MTETRAAGKPVSVVNLAPDVDTSLPKLGDHQEPAWKFVLVRTRERYYFVLGPVSQFRYHANLVDQFCRRLQITSTWARRPDLVEVVDPAVEVIGGGHLKLDSAGKSASIYGHSKAYGSFERWIVHEITRNHPYFCGLTISIDCG
ncbi:MAG: hypothetical protein AB1772_09040 [Candidatus Zixiibacteriota bacterium]